MRILILTAGEATRWGDFLGVPKHLARLAGESLLERTVRLCRERRPDADIRVVVRDMADRRYMVSGSKRAKARLTPEYQDGDKFASSRHLWDPKGRTVILYGDVWFSVTAMDQILTDGPHDGGWRHYGRHGASEVAAGGECFAFTLDPEAHDHASAALDRIIDARTSGEIWRNGGWEWYRALAGVRDDQLLDHQDYGGSTEIDDWTEDMDAPADWHNWCWRWAHATPAERAAETGGRP